MPAIYQPSGAAREYSPLALNYINGCDHGCVYCYVPKIMNRFRSNYIHSDVYIKEESQLLKEISSSAKKHRNDSRQVFLSFLTDPYSHFNNKTKLTRKILEILLQNKIKVSVLTKGGSNCLQDIDLFKSFGNKIQVGASLTFVNADDSKKWEKHAADPLDRISALEKLHKAGIKTWASMEPVIYPDQSLELMHTSNGFIDFYKIGKLNHFPKHENRFDWTLFLNQSIDIMRLYNKEFYIKNDLYKHKNDQTRLTENERNMDFLCL